MKREILFRAKSVTTGEFIEGYPTVDCKGNCMILHPLKTPLGGFQYFDAKCETVGQFTGRTDKKEVKIFEGDIIKEKDSNSLMERIYSVFWNEDYMQFWICDDVTLDSNPLDVLEFDYSEVIGNIYDNKDLL